MDSYEVIIVKELLEVVAVVQGGVAAAVRSCNSSTCNMSWLFIDHLLLV